MDGTFTYRTLLVAGMLQLCHRAREALRDPTTPRPTRSDIPSRPHTSGPSDREKIELQFLIPWAEDAAACCDSGESVRQTDTEDLFLVLGFDRRATNYGLSRRPFHVATPNQVQVQMEDRLSGLGADIVDRAIAIFDAALLPELGGD